MSDGASPAVVATYALGARVGRVDAINDDGLAVTLNGSAWSLQDGLVDLNTRLETHSGAGIRIDSARDVNASGQIVGLGYYDQDGNRSTPPIAVGVLLTPLADGDATLDQHVDAADLLTLARNYGDTDAQAWRTGDLTGDGAVDFTDLVTLADSYGSATTPADLAAQTDAMFAADWALAQSLVPEPSLVAVLVCGSALFPRRRATRRSV